jgi:hypothetical protein
MNGYVLLMRLGYEIVKYLKEQILPPRTLQMTKRSPGVNNFLTVVCTED